MGPGHQWVADLLHWLVGIAATFVVGVFIGGISGFFWGWLNSFNRATEIINAFPQLPLSMAIGSILSMLWSALKVYFAFTLVLSFLNWMGVVRGKILSLREEEYTTTARLSGANHRIIFRDLLPEFTSHFIYLPHAIRTR